MATIDLNLLKAGSNIPTPKREVRKEEAVIEIPPVEEPQKPERKFEGSNADILMAPPPQEIQIPVYNQPAPAPIPTQEPVMEPIRVVVIGGNENYYRSALERLNTSLVDIKFVKYIAVADGEAVKIMDSICPDVIVLFWKSFGMSAIEFWEMLQTSVDANGNNYQHRYPANKVIVVAPIGVSSEILLNEKGLNTYVNETNPQRHEVSIDALLEKIRFAHNDNGMQEMPSQESVERLVQQEPVASAPVEPQPQMVQSPVPQQQIASTPTPMPNYPPQQQVALPPQPATPPPQYVMPPLQATAQASVPPQMATPPQMQQQTYPPPYQQINQISQQEYGFTPPPPPSRPVVKRIKEIEQQYEEASKVIGVYSATGGAGTTTFATNLAAILAKYSNKKPNDDYRVALLEYNLACQCVDIFFNIKTENNICQLAKEVAPYTNEKNVVNIDTEKMKPLVSKYMYRDSRTGLDILLGLKVPLDFDFIREGFSKCLLNTLREMYDVVIVDMSCDMAKQPILETLYETDFIYYIMPMDVASIRNTKSIIDLLKNLFRFTPDRIRIILNKVIENNKEFDVNQVYRTFEQIQCEPEGTIPYEEEELISALNRGVPIAIESPEHPVSQSIFSIAAGINPAIEDSETEDDAAGEVPKKKGLFGGLFGKKSPKKDKKEKKGKKPSGKGLFGFGKKKEEADEDEPEPKKKGGLFGFGKKKKKSPPKDEEDFEEAKPKQSFFDKLKGLFSKKKKVGIKKKNKSVSGLLEQGTGEEFEYENGEMPKAAPPQTRLVSRRRPMGRR